MGFATGLTKRSNFFVKCSPILIENERASDNNVYLRGSVGYACLDLLYALRERI